MSQLNIDDGNKFFPYSHDLGVHSDDLSETKARIDVKESIARRLTAKPDKTDQRLLYILEKKPLDKAIVEESKS